MIRMLTTAALLAGSLVAAAGTASAQSVQFRIGDDRGYDRHDRYERNWDGPRRHYRGPYAAYRGRDCEIRTTRYFSERRGTWVVRKERVCD
jgi:hypothetical protein